MGIIFRKATDSDASDICNVLRESIKSNCVSDHNNNAEVLDGWCKNKTPQNLSNWIKEIQNVTIIVEKDGGNIVGVGQINLSGKITLCYLTSQIIGKGIGSLLLNTLEQEAIKLNLTRLYLNSTKTALNFYLRNGYKPCGMPISIDNQRTCYPMEKHLT